MLNSKFYLIWMLILLFFSSCTEQSNLPNETEHNSQFRQFEKMVIPSLTNWSIDMRAGYEFEDHKDIDFHFDLPYAVDVQLKFEGELYDEFGFDATLVDAQYEIIFLKEDFGAGSWDWFAIWWEDSYHQGAGVLPNGFTCRRCTIRFFDTETGQKIGDPYITTFTQGDQYNYDQWDFFTTYSNRWWWENFNWEPPIENEVTN